MRVVFNFSSKVKSSEREQSRLLNVRIKVINRENKTKGNKRTRLYFSNRCWNKLDISRKLMFLSVYPYLKWQRVHHILHCLQRTPLALLKWNRLFVHASLSRPWDCQLLTLMISKTACKPCLAVHIVQIGSYNVSLMNSTLTKNVCGDWLAERSVYGLSRTGHAFTKCIH